jgi:anaerobic selenocysteine-containing dehydrogenase
MSSSLSRRRVLKIAGAGALASAAGFVGESPAFADVAAARADTGVSGPQRPAAGTPRTSRSVRMCRAIS